MAEQPIFAIFEGGGAKGVAHIGAVAACERLSCYFVGVAGASAGAIIATLIAAGFSADEILDPDQPTQNLLARYGETPISLVGRGPWREFKRLEAMIKSAGSRKEAWRRRWAKVQLYRKRNALVADFGGGGYFDTQYAQRTFNRILRDQVATVRSANGLPGPHPQVVRFRDLDPQLCPEFRPLKIISANVDTQELAVFDREGFPDLEVAHAVAASIAIPGVFKPVSIRDGAGGSQRHMDGGAVANLPVWVFASDKLAYERTFPDQEPVPIVGFTLKSREPSPSSPEDLPPEWFEYAGKVLQTTLSASQSVIQDFLDDLTVVPLRTALGTLKFDASLAAMTQAFDHALEDADRDLKHYLFDYPALVKGELARFHAEVRRLLRERLPVGSRRRRILLRAAIVQSVARKDFRVTFAHNMTTDVDDRLRLDIRGRAATLAFTSRDVQFAPVGPQWSQPGLDYMTKYERALTNWRIQAIIAAPIFPDVTDWAQADPLARSEPCGVVTVDSDRGKELADAFGDSQFMSLFKAQSTLLYPALKTGPKRG